jgi:hypothetical protein
MKVQTFLMNTSISLKYVLGSITAAVLFAGCSAGGAQSFAPPGPAQQNPAQSNPNGKSLAQVMALTLKRSVPMNVLPDHQQSWMSPEAKTERLLYVSDQGTDDVDVFSYPKGKLVGTLTGFDAPYGQCADKSGNVFITQFDAANVVEYAHGRSNRIKTLAFSGQYPIGCSVDPKTGDLAVSTFDPGGVFVFHHAKGIPMEYTSPNLQYYFPPAYDDRGNLFVEAEAPSSAGSHVVELPYGESHFKEIYLNVTINYPGGAQWDGTYLALDDQLFGNTGGSGIYQIQVKGKFGTEYRNFALPGSCGSPDVVQPSIQGSKLVAPDVACGNVGFDKYPGGENEKFLHHTQHPIGATVSEVNI